jgi:hypothetical protein
MNDDLTQMNDSEFLAECRRMRDELADNPTTELIQRGEQLSDELVRRAGEAWSLARSAS